jgi:hypothetical protein
MAKFDSSTSKFYLNQFDLTTYTTDLTVGGGRALNEITTFGSSGANFHPANQAETFSWSGFYDTTATSGPDEVLGALRTSSTAAVVSYWPAGDTLGYPGRTGAEGWANTYETAATVGSVVTATATIDTGQTFRIKAAAAYATVTASTSGTSIDDAAASSAGGSWTYHIFALSAVGSNARWHLNLQHSSDNSSWADVSSATVTASDGVGAANTAFTGTLNRYVRSRVVLDASSGSLTYGISYTRL